jgi:hypothetical protein
MTEARPRPVFFMDVLVVGICLARKFQIWHVKWKIGTYLDNMARKRMKWHICRVGPKKGNFKRSSKKGDIHIKGKNDRSQAPACLFYGCSGRWKSFGT